MTAKGSALLLRRVLGVLVALTVVASIVGIYLVARMQFEDDEGDEQATCAIMLEVKSFDKATRARIADFEKAIAQEPLLEELGPGSGTSVYLLPPAGDGQDPLTRHFAEMTDAEWATAWKPMIVTDWYVPRYFRLDGAACVIRVFPRSALTLDVRQWPSGAVSRLQDLIEALKEDKDHFKSVRAYARNEIGDTADRDAINATFGVQIARVKIARLVAPNAPGQTMLGAEGMRLLTGVKPILVLNKSVRTVVTTASWLKYYVATLTGAEKEPDVPADETFLRHAIDFAFTNDVRPLMPQDGSVAGVDVTTSAEANANAELVYYMAATLQQLRNVTITGYKPHLKVKPLDSKPQ